MYNTGNPIPSAALEDMADNAQVFDNFVNSSSKTTPNRNGASVKTRAGFEADHNAQMQAFESDFDGRLAGMAFTRVGTFATGATLTDMRQVLVWEASQGGDGHEYGWSGAFPKVVAASSTPATDGGIGAGAWVDRTDATLRSDINIVIKRFACVADMVADPSLKTGQIVETLAFYYGLGYGGNKYTIVPAGTGNADNGSYISLNNGLLACGEFKHGVHVEQFGAIRSKAIDSTPAFSSALAYSSFVMVGAGEYRASISLNSRNSLNGAGSGALTSNAPFGKTTIYKGSGHGLTIDATSVDKYFCAVRGINFIDDTLDESTIGINFVGSSVNDINDNHFFHDIVVHGFTTGIKVIGRAIYCKFERVILRAGTKGSILLDTNTDNSDVSFNMNSFMDCGFFGSKLGAIRIVNQNVGNKFINCGIEGNNTSNTPGVAAMYISGSRNIIIDGCYFEGNGTGVPANKTTISQNSIDILIGESNAAIPGTHNPTIKNCWLQGATISIKIGNADAALTTPRTIVRGGEISNNLFQPGKSSSYSIGWALYAALTKENTKDANIIFESSNNIRSGTILVLPDGNNDCAVTYVQNSGVTVTKVTSGVTKISPYNKIIELDCDATGVGKTLGFDFLIHGIELTIRNKSDYAIVFDAKYFLSDTVNYIVNHTVPPKSIRKYYCIQTYDSDSRYKLVSKDSSVKMASAPPVRAFFMRGDVINNRAVKPGGYLGYVCTASGGAVEGTWASTATYSTGQWINIGGTACECTSSGTSGVSQPATPTEVGSVITSDGTCNWVCRSISIATLKTYGSISS